MIEKSEEKVDAIIFIHGWGLSSKIWNEQVGYFSKNYFIVNINLPGHGSETGAGPYSISRFTSDLKRRVEGLGIKKPVFIGSSLGGMVVLNYLLSFPGAAGAAVLIGAAPCFLKKEGFECGVSEIVLARLRKQLLKNCEKRMELFYEQLFADGKAGQTFKPPSLQVLIETLGELENWDIRERLCKIDLPVLIIHGERDSVFSTECARRLGKIKRSRVEFVSGGGHLPFLTYPEKVNSIIEKFLCSVYFSG